MSRTSVVDIIADAGRCFHCGLPADPAFSATIDGRMRAFCCGGCAAVAGFIQQSGLGNFYQYRDQVSLRPPEAEIASLEIYDDPDYQQGFVDVMPDGGRRARIRIQGMNCSACAWLVEKHLQHRDGVRSARVNYSQRALFLHWDPAVATLSQLLGQVQALGFSLSPDRPQDRALALRRDGRELLLRTGVAGIGMMQVGMYAIASYAGEHFGTGMSDSMRDLMRYASLFLATLVIFYAAQPFFVGAWRALKNRHLSIDVPVAVALGLSYGASLVATWRGTGEVYFDAVCMFTFFLLVSRTLEHRARSRWSLESDRSAALDQAILIEGEQQLLVAARGLRLGQIILVKTGQVVPADAELLDETAELDQAQLTGEFRPRQLYRGEEVSSGSINLGSPIQARVLRPQDQSAMAQIELIVSQAELHRPHIASLSDRLSGYFVAGLLTLAALTYVYWQFQAPERAFWIALSVLVVGCPCALSLATPTALTVLMRHLRRCGILVQEPAALETLARIDRVIFDKTGTLTEGKYRLNVVRPLADLAEAGCLQYAAALESLSNHPLAQAFAMDVAGEIQISDWRAVAGQGVEARLDSTLYRIGTENFVAELVGVAPQEQAQVQASELGQSLWLGRAGQWLAVFCLSDRLRPEAAETLAAMRAILPDLSTSLLSGDPSDEVARLAQCLGLDDWYRGLSPEDKYRRLKGYQAAGERVLSVGDGINDAPLLSAADASVALSSAVDLSKNKADFVLLSDNLMAIPRLLTNARRARRIIAQNLCWALGYNLTALPLAMLGLVPPWLAALGMSASSALVVLNAFRARVREVDEVACTDSRREAPC